MKTDTSPLPVVGSAGRTENPAASLSVDVDIADPGWRAVLDDPEKDCTRIAARVFGFLDYPPRSYEVSVVLTDDARQRVLNAEYRGKDAPTNVLSFPSGDVADDAFPEELGLPLGDITLALETVQREAESGGTSLFDHFCHLLVHGMLHLAGYDHENDEDAEIMEAQEIEILAGLGIANPYSAAETALQE